MWFELESGQTLYENGRYREALKQWNYIEKHVSNMIDDHADYCLYSFRRFTLEQFFDMITLFDDTIFQNRYVIKTAYNYVRLNNRIVKLQDQEREKLE